MQIGQHPPKPTTFSLPDDTSPLMQLKLSIEADPHGIAPNTPGAKLDDGSALSRQEGGRHYADMAIQPVQFIHANSIGYFEGNVIKYVSRHRAKNGIEDLRKARHYLDLLIEFEQAGAK